jgi:hypothetical protein
MAMRYYVPFPGQSGHPFQAVAPHVLRVGDAERDAAAADLGEHYVAGRLTLDELHERLGAVFSAKTYGQLARIMADLPRPQRQAAPGGLPAPTARSRSAGAAGAWTTAYPAAGFPPSPGGQQATPSDRAGRFAALALLVLAMLIWLFTALLFARHGFYYQQHMGPPGTGPFGPAGPGGPFGPIGSR